MNTTTCHPPYHKPLIIDGHGYEFIHLEPFVFSSEDLRQSLLLTYTINVRFSNHCFSEKFDPARHTEAMVVWDGSRKRGFEPERHTLSSRLPDIVRALPTRKVYQTGERRNHVAYEILEEMPNGKIYRIFLNLRTAGMDSVRMGCNLDLFVESAYPATERLRGTSTVRFTTLCYHTLKGLPVRQKR
jgi:hypothetical protein